MGELRALGPAAGTAGAEGLDAGRQIIGGIGGMGVFIVGWQRYRLRRSRLDPVVSAYGASSRRVLSSVVLTFFACALIPAIAVPLDTERQHGLYVVLGGLAIAVVGILGSMLGPWVRHGALVLDRDARSLVLEVPGQERLRINLRQPYQLIAMPAPVPGVVIAVEVHQADILIAFSYPWPKMLDPDAVLPEGREARRMPWPRLDVAARGIHEGLEP